MARFSNNPFPGVDVSQYTNWKQVTLPNGEVYYEVPGHPGYVYDPTLSSASGRTVFRANPKGQIDKQQEEEDRIKKAQDQQAFNQSVAGQAIPVGLGTAGLIAAQQMGAFGGGASASLPAAIGSGAVTLPGSAGAAAAQGALVGGTAAAPAAALPVASGALPAATGVAAAPVEATGLAMPAFGGVGIAPLAAIAAGTYLGGKSAYDLVQGKDDKSIPGYIGRGTLGIATGGLSELARASGFFDHKSTKDYQEEKWKGLIDEGVAGAAEQKAALDGLGDMSGKMYDESGKAVKWDFGTALDRVKSGSQEFNGAAGNFETFKNDWNAYTPEQKSAITKELANKGLYKSEKGSVLISDAEKAKEVRDSVLQGFDVGVKAATTPGQAAAAGAIGNRNNLITTGAQIPVVAPNRNTTVIRR